MRGRLTGTPDNVKATRYIADELRTLGLRPGGDNGTFLQRVPLSRMMLDSGASSVTLGDRTRDWPAAQASLTAAGIELLETHDIEPSLEDVFMERVAGCVASA